MRAIRPHSHKAATLLKALANEQRLLILCNLLDGPCSVGELNGRVDLSQSALSQHLALLRSRGLVTTRRSGQTILYSLAGREAPALLAALYEVYCSRVKA